MKKLILGMLWFAVIAIADECRIDPQRELLITDLTVIDDKRTQGLGPWSFGGIMQKLAGPTADAGTYTTDWLRQWRSTSLNHFPVRPRAEDGLELFWDRNAHNEINLRQSPFLLLAIVTRFDLAKPGKTAGEGRFVFGAYDPYSGEALPFTAIFEFELPLTDSFPTARTWVSAFHALATLPFGEAFNRKLQSLTDTFTNHLAQVRTNDFLLDADWELREFRRDETGKLRLATTRQTPDVIFQNERRDELIRWARENADEIQKETFKLPETFEAPAAHAPNEGFGWLREGDLPESVRRPLSLATCNGCHTGETKTRFTHIFPRRPFNEPEISNFLKTELQRRQALSSALLCGRNGSSHFSGYQRVH